MDLVGRTVMVVGTARSDINGKKGMVLNLTDGRYEVLLHEGGDTLHLQAGDRRFLMV